MSNQNPEQNLGGNQEEYGPAYLFGWESRSRYADKQWEDVEEELERDWNAQSESSAMSWDEAREVCQNGWNHVLSESCASDQPGLEQEPPSPR